MSMLTHPTYVALPAFEAGSHYRELPGETRLSLSENGLGCSALARRAVAEQLDGLHRYPDASAADLTEVLTDLHDLSAAEVVVGNGVDELLLLSALAFISGESGGVVTENTYAGHAHAVAATKAPRRMVPLRGYQLDVARIIDSMPRGAVVYVCNPHNPTGTALDRDEIAALVDAATVNDAILVVDEAYIEYAESHETCSAVEFVRAKRPVVVLRSFSKIYGLAGLRCGYAMATPALSAELRKLKNVLVFNVNRLALAAAEASLQDTGFVPRVRQQTRSAVKELDTHIAAWPWAQACPSVTNFLLVETRWPASVVCEELRQRRVLVRDGTDLGFANHIRISVSGHRDADQAVEALRGAAEHLSSGSARFQLGTGR